MLVNSAISGLFPPAEWHGIQNEHPRFPDFRPPRPPPPWGPGGATIRKSGSSFWVPCHLAGAQIWKNCSFGSFAHQCWRIARFRDCSRRPNGMGSKMSIPVFRISGPPGPPPWGPGGAKIRKSGSSFWVSCHLAGAEILKNYSFGSFAHQCWRIARFRDCSRRPNGMESKMSNPCF